MGKIIIILTGSVVSIFLISSQMRTNHFQADFMLSELRKIEVSIPMRDKLSPEVSSVDVAWHLDHSLKVINGIYDSLQSSNPDRFTFNLNPLRMFVWYTGKMARGKGQSPDYVRPPAQILTSDLSAQLNQAQANMAKIDQLPETSNFYHFAFGRLNRHNAKVFIEIHTNHHLSIIQDILSADAQNAASPHIPSASK